MGIQVTEDEADKRRKEIIARHRSGEIDPTSLVNPNKRFRYRGVNDKPERIARFETYGYEKVPEDDPAQWEFGNVKKDGKQLRNNEQVLMRIPRELYEERIKKNREKQQRMIDAGKEMTKAKVSKMARDAGLARPHKDAGFVEEG